MTNGANQNSPINKTEASQTNGKRQFTVTVTRQPKSAKSATTTTETKKTKADSVNDQRLKIFEQQRLRQRAKKSAPFPIEQLRDTFIEIKRFETAIALDRRGIEQMDALYTGFDHLYVVDDLIQQILADLPQHRPYGWEASSRVRNYLNLPTVGVLPRNVSPCDDNQSIMCYALTHFGVATYTNDRATYIGNIAGYLLISYYFAHLKIQYGVTPLRQGALANVAYTEPTVVTNTQHVADLPMVVKKKIYQLAVLCAQVSLYTVDKAIEKMLITEVNDFDKKKEQQVLANLLRYGG